MATNTTNYNLVKPSYSDTADIAVINGNMDIIDGQMKTNANGIVALNAKTTQKYTDKEDISSLSDLESMLNAELVDLPNVSKKFLRFHATTNFGIFKNDESYYIEMSKSSSTTYSQAMITRNGSSEVIVAKKDSNGWSYDILALESKGIVKSLDAGTISSQNALDTLLTNTNTNAENYTNTFLSFTAGANFGLFRNGEAYTVILFKRGSTTYAGALIVMTTGATTIRATRSSTGWSYSRIALET